jgi:diguanylate cyclase (GGDEF)-like protein
MQTRRLIRLALVAGVLAVAAHGVHAVAGADWGLRSVFDDGIYTAVEVLACALVIARAVTVREERLAWSAVAASLVLWAAGDLLWTAWLNAVPDPPFPSVADALYYASYPPLYLGLGLLLRSRVPLGRSSLWLDGLIAGFAAAGLASALVFEPVRMATHGDAATVACTLAYPVLDMALLGMVMVAFGLSGWRPGRTWLWLGAGQLLNALADCIYTYQASAGTYVAGTLLDTLWPAAFVLVAVAAWTPAERRRVGDQADWRAALLPAAFAVLALGLLVAGQALLIGILAAVLSASAILVAGARAGLTFAENRRLLGASRVEARLDVLSGLPNRRALLDDLDVACAEATPAAPRILAFFDLDGFKSYNDSFGHAAGDALLRRLGERLAAAVAGHGTAYRLGGDEFCVLLDPSGADATAVTDLLVTQALGERGDGFEITASQGFVAIPTEAPSPSAALQLADQRMYRDKNDRRGGTRRQARDVLLAVLSETEPDLDDHTREVTRLAVAVAGQLAEGALDRDVLARAAELHDIGKVAIPDEVLHKPAPLSDEEWRLMRQHTVIGERILAVAAGMRPVAAVVRSTHERWDGSGYPDGLHGDDIPLAARVIAVCDAFDAMTTDRPYSAARTAQDALAELRRCAGTHFDPAVVRAFERIADRALATA